MDHHMASAPSGIWEYVIVAIAIAVFLISLYLIINFFSDREKRKKTTSRKRFSMMIPVLEMIHDRE